MLNRLKTALVSSFVGALALGWVFAQAISHAVSIPITPIASWISRREFRDLPGRQSVPDSFFVQDAVPELLRTVCLALIGYALLRWLYYKPLQTESGTDPVLPMDEPKVETGNDLS